MNLKLLNEGSNLESRALVYQHTKPFPHIVIDQFLDHDIAEQAHDAFPSVGDDGWIHYMHYNEKKHGLNKMQFLPEIFQTIIQELNSPGFLKSLEKLTGTKNLLADDTLEGGGLHQSSRGGFLNIHADFNVHPHDPLWRRRANLLIYFNKDWKPDYGGELQLWDGEMKKCEASIAPVFNRCVIFNTDYDSFHGFPDPLQCPENITRKSLALYYYTRESVKPKKVATNYMGRPDDGFKKGLIWADKKVLAIYNRVKGALNLNDDFVSNLLRRINRK